MSPLGANPLKRFLPNLAWKRESHFLTLTQNFIIVDLKIGLRAPEIAKIGNFWYKFAPKGQRGSLPILSIYNGKASPKDCKNYRGISLLSTPGKVFATVLLNKVHHQLLAHRRVKQSGLSSEVGKSFRSHFGLLSLTWRLQAVWLYGTGMAALCACLPVSILLKLDFWPSDRSYLVQTAPLRRRVSGDGGELQAKLIQRYAVFPQCSCSCRTHYSHLAVATYDSTIISISITPAAGKADLVHMLQGKHASSHQVGLACCWGNWYW